MQFLAECLAQTVKHLPTMWETWVRSLGREDPLEKEMARAIQQIPSSHLFYLRQCKFLCYSFHTSHPLLPSPHVHKSILYAFFSIAAL